ncbi:MULTISPECIES: hypothetical protein [unclassified Nostoc]|jgi:ABC-type transporter Mla subunit MlaD|uniref:hypothetical protein n=1 Tax=unclassified Nostoc TaxID=2593658 RepID=UPI000DECAEA4|nr:MULTISPECIES: hypothetical protein [unclassified Nostoc]MBD2511768.1 hypothetical protein [Desmonostoc muscorum FACHB-395]MCC5654607.1 hypothetical protein [Nostoc sp. XA013]MDZ8233969.1 hypothetical protein [Nostoc sp. ChiQUE02]MEA5622422.1 hypothetical protein [Nostoc sp. UHCC 0251]QHG21287.1 hypothetical protein GJB62_36210 [Nostoc sp. ATCC 53789]
MTEAQIQDIYSRLDTLTAEVNSLKLLTGTIGTSQVAISQILNTVTEHSQVLNAHTADLNQLKTDMSEILRILRDRNGGSGL